MSILTGLRQRLGYYKRVRAFGSAETAGIIQRNLPTICWPLRPEGGGRIACDALGLSIDPQRHEYVLQNMPLFVRLRESGVGQLETSPEGDLLFVVGSVRIAVTSKEVAELIEEVFITRVYDFTAPRDCIVLDIGMNVGLASLFFAGVKGFETVGYEPFPEMFAAAVHNIQSSGLGGRIETRNEAVADKDGTAKLPFDPSWTGRNSLYFESVYGVETGQTRDIRIVDANPVLREMYQRAEGRALAVKMDCEGSEYAIVDRWLADDLLRYVDVIVLEHHPFVPGKSAESLRQILLDAGFVVQLPRAKSDGLGIMWAVRTRSA